MNGNEMSHAGARYKPRDKQEKKKVSGKWTLSRALTASESRN